MTPINSLKSLLTVLAVLTAVVAANRQTANAQIRPFHIRGAGVSEFIPSVPNEKAKHTARGRATFLGTYTGAGEVQLVDFINETSASFQSGVPFVFQGKNETLSYHYGRPDEGASKPGIVRLIPAGRRKVIAIFDAEFTLAEPTTKVEASKFRMIAVTKPFVFGAKDPVRYSWRGFGWIKLAE